MSMGKRKGSESGNIWVGIWLRVTVGIIQKFYTEKVTKIYAGKGNLNWTSLNGAYKHRNWVTFNQDVSQNGAVRIHKQAGYCLVYINLQWAPLPIPEDNTYTAVWSKIIWGPVQSLQNDWLVVVMSIFEPIVRN